MAQAKTKYSNLTIEELSKKYEAFYSVFMMLNKAHKIPKDEQFPLADFAELVVELGFRGGENA